MFDPAEARAKLAPGDKVSMTYHKAKAEPATGGSFVGNAQAAGLIPGGAPAAPAVPAHMPQPMAVSRPAVLPLNGRAMLLAHLRRRMGLR